MMSSGRRARLPLTQWHASQTWSTAESLPGEAELTRWGALR